MVKFSFVLCLLFTITLCARISNGDLPEELSPNSPTTTNPPISLSEKIKTVNAALLKYDRELDRMVPFKEIREALQGLDIMAQNYTGSSIEDISRASHSGYQATDSYFRATDTIIQWCSKAETVFNYLLDSEDDLDQELIEKGVKKTLKEGLDAFKRSIKTLETVADHLSKMERALRPVPEDLKKELREIQLMENHAVGKLRGKKLKINTALTMLGMLVGFILSFYLGPIGGGIIGLGIKMSLTAIPTAVIEGRMVPSMDQKLKIAEAYYLSVIQTVEHSKANVTNVRDALHKRLYFVDIDLKTDKEVDVDSNVRRNESEADLIRKELRRFLSTLREMMSRHMSAPSRQQRAVKYHHPTPLHEEHFPQYTLGMHDLIWKRSGWKKPTDIVRQF